MVIALAPVYRVGEYRTDWPYPLDCYDTTIRAPAIPKYEIKSPFPG